MKKVTPLRYGVIFKKAFSQPEVFTTFVKAVLGIDIEIDKVETEKSFKPIIGKVDCRFDLYAEDPKNRLIIDIQHDRTGDHYHRFMYYHLIAVAEQVATAKNYRPNLRVLTIVVLTGYDKHQVDLSAVDFDPKSRKGQLLGEIPHKIVYLAPHYVADDTPEPLRQWLLAIKDTLDEQVDETDYTDPLFNRSLTPLKPISSPQPSAPRCLKKIIKKSCGKHSLSLGCSKVRSRKNWRLPGICSKKGCLQ